MFSNFSNWEILYSSYNTINEAYLLTSILGYKNRLFLHFRAILTRQWIPTIPTIAKNLSWKYKHLVFTLYIITKPALENKQYNCMLKDLFFHETSRQLSSRNTCVSE